MTTGRVMRALAGPVMQRGAALLALAEDQWFDRKSARIQPRELAEAEIALANAEGGILVVGLHGGKVEGIGRHREQISGWQQAGFDHAVPPLRAKTWLADCVNHRGEPDELLVVEVDTGNTVHATTRDDVLLRVGDENRRLGFQQRQELMYEKGQASFEATALPGATHDELDEVLLAEYAAAVRHPDPLRLLIARGLRVAPDQLTIGGLLLFGKHPQSRFPEATVRVLRYRGTARGTGARQQLVHDERCEGPIPTVIERARLAIVAQMPTRRALAASGRFEPIGLIPRDAWLEGLVNAVIHRAYSVMGDHIRVEIFDDRVEVESPGRFPGLIDLHPPRLRRSPRLPRSRPRGELSDPMAVTRFARNPRIARVCADLAFGQELGEGIRRIFEEMRLAGLVDPQYRQTAGSVRLVLSSEPVDRQLEARLPSDARDLLRLVRERGRVGTGELVELSGLSRPVVIRRMQALRDEGLVTWVGQSPKDPRAFWKIRSD